MYFEGSINSFEASRRKYLYETLDADDPPDELLKEILDSKTIKEVLSMEGDAEEPWKGRAKRLTVPRPGGDPFLKTHGGTSGWESFEQALSSVNADEGALHSYV
jgi:hypothetical protein